MYLPDDKPAVDLDCFYMSLALIILHINDPSIDQTGEDLKQMNHIFY